MDLKELDALLESAKLPETTVTLCLRGDLQAEWEQADRGLSQLREQQPARTLAGSPEESALAEQVRQLEEKMAAATLTVRLRALHRKPWLKLISDHGPRKGNDGDRVLGVNQDTFFDALVGACIVEPELDETRREKLLGSLTDAQFGKLSDAAWALNRRDVNVPFSRNVSRTTTSSGETSKQQSG